jgi:hypothetical protein
MYENVMGTPEQNAAAEKRMEERDKKNPDSMPAKINKAAKAVTGKNSESGEEVLYGRPIDEATGKQTGKSRPIATVKQTTETITTPKKDAGKNATENMKEYGMKKGGSVKRYSVGGTLKGMKDTYMEGARKTGDDIHRIAGTAKGKALDKAAKEKENRGIDIVKLMDAMDRKDAGKSAAENTKQYGMKKGGMTASRRADGIAMRGKTKGKMY